MNPFSPSLLLLFLFVSVCEPGKVALKMYTAGAPGGVDGGDDGAGSSTAGDSGSRKRKKKKKKKKGKDGSRLSGSADADTAFLDALFVLTDTQLDHWSGLVE